MKMSLFLDFASAETFGARTPTSDKAVAKPAKSRVNEKSKLDISYLHKHAGRSSGATARRVRAFWLEERAVGGPKGEQWPMDARYIEDAARQHAAGRWMGRVRTPS